MSDVFEQAVRLLARREHSVFELKQKLAKKGYGCNDIEHAIAECQKQGYQSDDRYVEQFCRYRVGQGDGPLKIKHSLQQKGIAKNLIHHHLDLYDWYGHALGVYRKRFTGLSSQEEDYKTRQKQIRFMQGRGFDIDVIKACLASIEGKLTHES